MGYRQQGAFFLLSSNFRNCSFFTAASCFPSLYFSFAIYVCFCVGTYICCVYKHVWRNATNKRQLVHICIHNMRGKKVLYH